MRKFYFPRSAIVGLFLLLLCGCNTLRNGGAPEPSFNVDKDLAQLAKNFGEATTIDAFYKNPSLDARNKFIAARLVMMNIRYIQFVRKSTCEKQFIDSAVDILTISLNLAGATVSSAATKTILASVAAGVTGSKSAVDKNFFHEKTLPALIASMNAQRKQVLISILEGSKKNLDDYPFEQTITDLHAYYFAGTYMGAIQAIQSDAGAKEQKADTEIVKLSKVTKEDVITKQSLTKAIGQLTEADLPKIKAALKAFSPDSEPPAVYADALEALQDCVRQARNPEEIGKAGNIFRKSGILK